MAESGAGFDASPGVLQVREVQARLAARDHPRIVRIAGQGGQQPHRRGRQRHGPAARLGIRKPKLADVEINVLPEPGRAG